MSDVEGTPKKSFFNKTTFIIIDVIILIGIILVVLGPSLFKKEDTRTVMIYLEGSNLESDGGIATADLNSIDPSKIDLTKTNILLYTGGTKKWHNFVSSDENAIYKLTPDGFVKLESYEKLDMANDKTLSSFLNYAYDNFKTTKYDLIIYDHGAAIRGAVKDDFTGNIMSLESFSKALNDSPFKEKNKLEAIIFKTCLNGTIEVANTFKDHAEYLIASEEVTWGSPESHAFSYLNDTLPSDTAETFGIKFIEDYIGYMKKMDPFERITKTYSITDLSKIDDLNQSLNKYFNSLNLGKNYKEIASARSKVFGYGMEQSSSYGSIDLYNFVEETKKLAPSEGEDLQNKIKTAVIYSNSNRSDSYGLSIFFPFEGSKIIRAQNMDYLKGISSLSSYYSFVSQFNDIKDGKTSYDFMFKASTIDVNDKEISYKLSDEEAEVFASANILLVKQDKEHSDYYYPILLKDVGTKLDSNTIKTTLEKDFIRYKDEHDEYHYIYQRINREGLRTIPATFLYKYEGNDTQIVTSELIVDNFEGNMEITKAKATDRNELVNGMLLNLIDFDVIEYYYPCYRMYDENGKLSPLYESAPVHIGVGYSKKEDVKDGKYNFKFEKTNLEGENIYAIFAIADINGNTYFSDMIKVGE